MSSILPPFARDGVRVIHALLPKVPQLDCDVRISFEAPSAATNDVIEAEIALRQSRLSSDQLNESNAIGRIRMECNAEAIAKRLKSWDFEGHDSPPITAEMVARVTPPLFESLHACVIRGTYSGEPDPKKPNADVPLRVEH